MKLLRGALALLLTAALLALPASAQQVWKWSTTSGSNSNADPAINWTTGMAPSAVSPSSRAMMAAVARWRDDVSGSLGTGGTASAYTLTTNSSVQSLPPHGYEVSFIVSATNAANATLAVDSGPAYAIQTTLGTNAPAGTILANTTYTVWFSRSSNTWLLHSYFGNPASVPIGGIIPFAGTTLPNGNFAFANGQCISRTTYSALFTLVGTTYGACDGSTTFGLPDLRARQIAGLDNMGAAGTTSRISAAGGNFDATVLGATGGAQNHTLTSAEMPAHTHPGTTDGSTVSGTTASSGSHDHGGSVSGVTATHTHNYNTAANKTAAIAQGSGAVTISIWNGNDTATASTTESANHSHTITSDGAHTHTFNAGSHTHTFTTGSTGSGTAHTVLDPVMVMPMIIRIL